MRVTAVHLAVTLRVDYAAGTTRSVLTGDLILSRLIADRRQLRSDAAGVAGWLASLRVSGSTTLDRTTLCLSLGSSLTFPLLCSLALVLLFLLASLPFLADFFELY